MMVMVYKIHFMPYYNIYIECSFYSFHTTWFQKYGVFKKLLDLKLLFT